MKEKDIIIAYGVNIILKGENIFTRYATVNTLEEAKEIQNVLLHPTMEPELWDAVEIEKIAMIDGEPTYDRINLRYTKGGTGE